MDNKLIIFRKPGGGVGIIIPFWKNRDKYNSDEEYLNYTANKNVPSGHEWKIVDSSEVPYETSKSYREAWKYGSAGITVDLDLAKQIKINLLEDRIAGIEDDAEKTKLQKEFNKAISQIKKAKSVEDLNEIDI